MSPSVPATQPIDENSDCNFETQLLQDPLKGKGEQSNLGNNFISRLFYHLD